MEGWCGQVPLVTTGGASEVEGWCGQVPLVTTGGARGGVDRCLW